MALKRRGLVYSTDPNWAVKPKSPNNGIRSSRLATKQRYTIHMKRSSTAGADTSALDGVNVGWDRMGQDLVVEFVAQHDHVLEMFPAAVLKGISVVPDLRLPEEIESTTMDDTAARAY